ncbi:MAG: DUF2058 domain-containing protein [Steroidobacteraceae bacterium]
MSASLRDQLLKAGLVNEKQAKEAERQLEKQQQGRQQLSKRGRGLASEQELAARQAQLAKAARDQELNRRQQEQADRRGRLAQIKQLIEQNRLPKAQADESYHFVHGNRVRRIPADAAVRERLARGEIAIVCCEGRYDLVPATTAARIRERDERAVIGQGAAGVSASADDGYSDFAVPDDMVW